MSRYLILQFFTLPVILSAILGVLVSYKVKRLTRTQFILHESFWLVILLGIVFAQNLYEWLYSNNFTQTESLSLFDVVQVTAIISLFYVLMSMVVKLRELEKRVNGMHTRLSIKDAE